MFDEEDSFTDLDATIGDGLDELDNFTEEDVKTIVEAIDNPKEPNEALIEAGKKHDAFGQEMENSIVQKLETPHLPKEDGLEARGKKGPLYAYRTRILPGED